MMHFKSKKKSGGVFGRCEKLWQQCIKARAGWKCEATGRHGEGEDRCKGIVGHHWAKKPTYALRFSLDNGICIANERHSWTHYYGHEFEMELIARRIRTPEEVARVDLLRKTKMRRQGKADLAGIEIYLKQELERFKAAALAGG